MDPVRGTPGELKGKLDFESSWETVRKLDRFGCDYADVTFEWPTREDFERFNLSSKMLVGFKWKDIKTIGKTRGISAIQLLFAGKQKSPLFSC